LLFVIISYRIPQSFLEDILSRQNQSHDTFASWLLSEGTLPKELMDVGGWKSVASMDGYMHLVRGRKQEVSARIEGRLLR
jgi:hypothetical protein